MGFQAHQFGLVTDRPDMSRDVAAVVTAVAECRTIELDELDGDVCTGAAAVIIDVDLTADAKVQTLRDGLARSTGPAAHRLVVLDEEASRRALVQAAALNASTCIRRPLDSAALVDTILDLARLNFEARLNVMGGAVGAGVGAAQDALRSMLAAGAAGTVNPEHIADSEEKSLAALQEDGLVAWIRAVRQHHSHTYRHCLLVTGLAAAFTQRLGMRQEDQRLITRAALVHDVGKARIPLAILDKPERLTTAEMEVMRRHTVYGRDIVAGGGFSSEVVDAVLHHHELLDGSGYPDGLAGNAIGDFTRMITVVDIFAALIEQRAYKPPLPPLRAFQMLVEMGDKLDAGLVRAFRTVALQAA